MNDLTKQLADALTECVEDSQSAVDQHILTYGENWRPQRIAAMRQIVANARDALAAFAAQQSASEQPAPLLATLPDGRPAVIPLAEQPAPAQGEREAFKAFASRYFLCGIEKAPGAEARVANAFWRAALAQRQALVPLTREQVDRIMTKHYPLDSLLRENVDAFEACVRDIETELGITAPKAQEETK